ncbi:MAG: HAD-IC family P-type ATPase, partial [Oscillospiraceae bacterium]
TLTTGKLGVSQVVSVSSYSDEEVLRIAAMAESLSNHPIAKAIVAHCPDLGTYTIDSHEDIVGKGVRLRLDNKEILCGSAKLMKENAVSITCNEFANIYVVQDGVLLGYLNVFDRPRTDAVALIQRLKSLGVTKTVMLTGDSKKTAEEVRTECGIDFCYSELLPEDKVAHLTALKNDLGTIVFVGDGINDAPVLACADIGIAMGFGSDVAIDAADTVLLSDRLSSLADAIVIAKETTKTARFNIIFALIIKAIVLILGSIGIAPMWVAVFADVGVSIIAVLNATKILRKK